MSRPAPKNLDQIAEAVVVERDRGRPWKEVAQSIEERFGVSYGRTRLTQLYQEKCS